MIAVKHMGPGNQALGYKRIARHLALPIGEVRAAERSIRDKFERYATAARAHEAALERKLGQLLPVPPAAEQARGRIGAWRDVLADWLGRPFASDATPTATHLAASGAGRGAGTALAVKLATICLGGGSVIGAACLATGVLPQSAGPATRKRSRAALATRPPHRRRRPRSRPRARGAHDARARDDLDVAAKRSRASATTQGGSGPRDHERAPASPAPADAARDGSSEFDPTYQPSQPAAPAPVPAAPGATEFF